MSVTPLQVLQSNFDPNVWVGIDNKDDKYVAWAMYHGDVNSLPDYPAFEAGAKLIHVAERTEYINIAATGGITPIWSVAAGAGACTPTLITTIDYTDLNAAPASTAVTVQVVGGKPVNKRVCGVIIDITQAFVSSSYETPDNINLSNSSGIFSGETLAAFTAANLVEAVRKISKNDVSGNSNTTSEVTDVDIEIENFGGSAQNNPQDFTQGSMDVYLLLADL